MSLEDIPSELVSLKRWLNWRKSDDGVGKFPCSPDGEKIGWDEGRYDIKECLRATETNKYGLGFSLDDSNTYAVFDFDVKEGQKPKEDQSMIVTSIDSYTEVSPSGRGVHVWVKLPQDYYDELEDGVKSSRLGIEFYKSKRFITFTGERVKAFGDDDGSIKLFEDYSHIENFIQHIRQSRDTSKTSHNGSVSSIANYYAGIFEQGAFEDIQAVEASIMRDSKQFETYEAIMTCSDSSPYHLQNCLDKPHQSNSEFDQALANIIFGHSNDFIQSLEIFESSDRFKNLLNFSKKHGQIDVAGRSFHEYSVRTMITACDLKCLPSSDEAISMWLISDGNHQKGLELKEGMYSFDALKNKNVKESSKKENLEKSAKSLGLKLKDASKRTKDRRKFNNVAVTELPNCISDIHQLCEIIQSADDGKFFNYLSELNNYAHTNYPEILVYVTITMFSAFFGNVFSYRGHNTNIQLLLAAPTGSGKKDIFTINKNFILGMFEDCSQIYDMMLSDQNFQNYDVRTSIRTLEASPQATKLAIIEECGQTLPNVIFHIPECGSIFKSSLSSKSSSRDSDMYNFLIELGELNRGDSIKASKKVGSDDQKEIHYPSISEYSETQCDELDSLICNIRGQKSGLLNRRLVLRVDESPRNSVDKSTVKSTDESNMVIKDFIRTFYTSYLHCKKTCFGAENQESVLKSFNSKIKINPTILENDPNESDAINEYLNKAFSYYTNYQMIENSPHEVFADSVLQRVDQKIYKLIGAICVLRNIENLCDGKAIPKVTMQDAMLGLSLFQCAYANLYQQSLNGKYEKESVAKCSKGMAETYLRLKNNYIDDLDSIRNIDNFDNFKTKVTFLTDVICKNVSQTLKAKAPFTNLENSHNRNIESTYEAAIAQLLCYGVIKSISKIDYYRRLKLACKENNIKLHPEVDSAIEKYEIDKKGKDYDSFKALMDDKFRSKIYLIDFKMMERFKGDH